MTNTKTSPKPPSGLMILKKIIEGTSGHTGKAIFSNIGKEPGRNIKQSRRLGY